jgi:hypothetical protein
MADPVMANIIKSGAVMWYAPVGETLPDETDVDAGDAWGGNWVRVGYTNAPVVLTYDDSRMQVQVQEFLGPLNEWRTAETVQMTTTLAELIADYLALLVDGTVSEVAAGASQKAYEELDVGDQAQVTKYSVGFEGIRYDASDNALPVRVFFEVATLEINGAMEWSKRTDSYVNVPILIKGFVADPDAGSGYVFKFQRVTAPASS